MMRAWAVGIGLVLAGAIHASADESAWTMLRGAVDPGSGAVLLLPGAPLPEGGADPRTAAWAAWAFDLRGHHAEAGRALAVFAAHAVLEPRRGVPAGLLPALLHPDGRPALPWAVRDLDGLAWFITACHRHLGYLEGTAREEFAAAAWPAMATGADLLADWSLGPNGPMLPSFQWALGRDGTALETQVLALAALEAAVDFAGQWDIPPNVDWQTRAGELLARLLLRAHEETLSLDPWVAVWLRTGLLAQPPARLARLGLVSVDTGAGPMPWQRVEMPPTPMPPTNTREAAARVIANSK